MKKWTRLIIDVDYSPSDPGTNNWFCDRTDYDKADVTAGKILPYKDSGGLFRSIRVVEASDAEVVLEYCGKQYSLTPESCTRKLDEDGRDYTNFYLYVSLKVEYVIENTREFFRQFQTRDQMARLSKEDIRQFEASDDPCAKFVLGRWHLVTMPEEDSLQIAEKNIREAVTAGIADAFNMLSLMYANGDTAEDRVDLEESAHLRDEALRLGSEAASLRYARNRISGILLAPEEPEVVAREIETLLAEDPEPNPEWYSVLAYAYETLGRDEDSRKAYKTGTEKGCLRCWAELAYWFREHGMEKEYENTMYEGMSKGCPACFMLSADRTEEEYEEKTPELKRHFTRWLTDNLERGLELCEGTCAYYLAYNYFYGALGFEKDGRKAGYYLDRGMLLGDSYCYSFAADILEMYDPSDQDKRDAAVYRLKALRLGNDSVQSKVIIAYRRGLLNKYQDEIEKYWLPDEYEPDGDDGRWDAYA